MLVHRQEGGGDAQDDLWLRVNWVVGNGDELDAWKKGSR